MGEIVKVKVIFLPATTTFELEVSFPSELVIMHVYIPESDGFACDTSRYPRTKEQS